MKTIKKMLLAIVVIVGVNSVNAQNVFKNKENVANNGYDVVNYFTNYDAQRGNKTFSTDYKGATYYFVNAENLKNFKSAPEKYLPQFDGYCAFAVAKMNKKVAPDPNTFKIDNGKLYLFFNDFYEGAPFNTIVPWINNEADMEKAAIENWKTLKNK